MLSSLRVNASRERPWQPLLLYLGSDWAFSRHVRAALPWSVLVTRPGLPQGCTGRHRRALPGRSARCPLPVTSGYTCHAPRISPRAPRLPRLHHSPTCPQPGDVRRAGDEVPPVPPALRGCSGAWGARAPGRGAGARPRPAPLTAAQQRPHAARRGAGRAAPGARPGPVPPRRRWRAAGARPFKGRGGGGSPAHFLAHRKWGRVSAAGEYGRPASLRVLSLLSSMAPLPSPARCAPRPPPRSFTRPPVAASLPPGAGAQQRPGSLAGSRHRGGSVPVSRPEHGAGRRPAPAGGAEPGWVGGWEPPGCAAPRPACGAALQTALGFYLTGPCRHHSVFILPLSQQ